MSADATIAGAGAADPGETQAAGETLVLAVPSKGRIREDALACLEKAGIAVEPPRDARSYRAGVPGVPGLEIAFLSASEIARELAAGRIALGMTGLDLMWEAAPAEHGGDGPPDHDADVAGSAAAPADERVSFGAAQRLGGLGFGSADVVVAVPRLWVDVSSMVDLADVAGSFPAEEGRQLLVATKYHRLTRHHMQRAGVRPFRIVESLGATEGAPHAGLADIIVDITSTGSTLRANELKVVAGGRILSSEISLFASASEADGWPADALGARVVRALLKGETPAHVM